MIVIALILIRQSNLSAIVPCWFYNNANRLAEGLS